MGQFVFVSCWTKEEKESIPIWNMYGRNLCGVRIALPKFPFYHYPGYSHTPQGSPEAPFGYSTIFPNIHFNQGYILPQGCHYLKEVKYTDDPSLLIPIVVEQVDDHHRTNWIDKIGTYKTTAWSFQSEVRYKLNVLPRKFTGKEIDFYNIPIMEKTFGYHIKGRSISFDENCIKAKDHRQPFDRNRCIKRQIQSESHNRKEQFVVYF